MEKIPINIWDDYYDDGYVPKGEKQETYAYVENYELSTDVCKNALERLYNHIIANNLLADVKVKLAFNNGMKRWEINFTNLTHELREKLVKTFESKNLYSDDKKLRIYSES